MRARSPLRLASASLNSSKRPPIAPGNKRSMREASSLTISRSSSMKPRPITRLRTKYIGSFLKTKQDTGLNMAVLYITEYATLGVQQVGGMVSQTPQEPPLAEQTVAISGSSAQSSAFNAQTTLVRLHTDAICSIEFGTNPTATVWKGAHASQPDRIQDGSARPELQGGCHYQQLIWRYCGLVALSSSGNFAIFAAMRRASSRVSRFVTERR